MKSKMKKKMIAFLLCMVLVICNSVSILADTPAAETTTTEQKAKETRTAKNEGTSEEETSSDNSKDTSKSSEETEETKEEAPETKTTEKKEETTGATTEKKEESATATTTEKKEETEESSEISEKKETEEAEETATTGSEEETSESEEETTVSADLVYEDDDVKITVGANEENAIPEGATLKVVPVLKDNDKTTEQYQEVEKKLEEKATNEEYDIAGFLAYDITFVDEGGNKVEPDGEVQVSMEYKESAVPVEIKDDTTDSNVTVMHLEENEEGQVKEVVDMSKNDQLKDVKTTETQKIEKAEFVTDSFSVFTITWIRSDNGESTFNFSSQIHMVKQEDGNRYVDMTATVSEGNLILETEDANPVLYTSTISSSGTNNQLYSVQESYTTYRFTGAYVAIKNTITYYNIAEDAQKITKLTGRKNSVGQKVMMYQLTGDTSYRNLENNQCVVFVYSDDSLTTSAQCYSQNGEQLSYGDRNQKDVNLMSIGDNLDVRNDNEVIPSISNYTYSYTVVGEGDNAIEVDYLRYTNGYLQYSLDGTNWSDVNSEPVKFIYSSNGGYGYDAEPGQIKTADTRGLIDIDLFNYDDADNFGGLKFGSNVGQWTGDKTVTQGLVAADLSENGYPVLSGKKIDFVNDPSIDKTEDQHVVYNLGTDSLESLFDGSWNTDSKNYGLNHLFIYNPDTGYYSYDSDSNYAYYDISENNTERNFIVYNQAKVKGSSNETINGAFMPFSEWNDSTWDKEYTFGMHIGFDFTQPENGQVNGQDMTFEFSGDDDVWVFIGGKLVLDIGGIHNAASGSINFATGEVYVNGERQASLSEIFDLSGETFTNNSTHRLEFFYLERGAGASNCSLKFNMPPKKSDTIEITKEITNTDKKKYANIEFSFKAYLQDEEFEDEVYEVIPKGTLYKVKKNGELTGETREVGDGNIFKLKSGETAVFEDINPNLKYYVQEVAVDSDEFDKVEIDGWEVEYINDKEETVDTDVGDPDKVKPNQNYIAQSKPKVVSENAVIKFKNNCAESNMNELQITKYMAEGQEYQANDTFTLLVKLEDTDGNLVPYEGEYYITQGEGNDTKYYNSNFNQIEGGEPAGKTEDGKIPIRVGYTVSITDIMSGTSFDVEETGLDGATYDAPTINVVKETAGNSNVTDDNGQPVGKGSILLSQNAQVTVTNSKKIKDIYAEKAWGSDASDTRKREAVKFGLFKEEKNNQDKTVLSLIQVKDVDAPAWKCTFKNVPVKDANNQDITYYVKEVRKVSNSEKNEPDVYGLTVDGDTNYYQVIDSADEETDNDSFNPYYEVNETVTGTGTQEDPYVITNILKTFNVNVVKTGSDDQLLAGVEFQLCRDKNGENPLKFTGSSGQYVYSVSGEIDTLVTIDNTGKNDEGEYNPNLTITGLPAGTYYLIETKTVSGHNLLANPVEVILPITNTDGADEDYYYTETVDGVTTYYYDVNTFNIKNNQLFTMPEAGGRNIFMLTLAGTAMIALAAGSTIYYRRRRGAHNKTRR